MENLLALDLQVFLFINHWPHIPIIVIPALILSGVGTYGLVWFILGGYLFIREEEKDHLFFLPLLTAGLITISLVELFLKPLFARLRPSPETGAIIAGFTQSDTYSFPSGHAAVAFALVGIIAEKEPRWKWWLYLLAVGIALSRIYLGRHYPLDVVAGGLIGYITGKSVAYIFHRFFYFFGNPDKSKIIYRKKRK